MAFKGISSTCVLLLGHGLLEGVWRLFPLGPCLGPWFSCGTAVVQYTVTSSFLSGSKEKKSVLGQAAVFVGKHL